MNYLVYLLIGESPVFRRELEYALLSLDKTAGPWTRENVTVVIYHDNELSLPGALQNLKIIFKQLTRAKVREILEEGNGFFLFMKPWIIRECLREFSGNVLFVDTDTFFMQDPGPLFRAINAGKLIMHLKEHKFSVRPFLKRYLKEFSLQDRQGIDYSIKPGKFYMWNSGVIGLNPRSLPLLEEVIHMTKQISATRRWHTTEQLAFSYFFAGKEPVLEADKYIFHYWFYKPAVYLLSLYFNDSPDSVKKIRPELGRYAFPASFEYEEIPRLIFELGKHYAMVSDFLFSCLPFRTVGGKLLRRSLCTDVHSFLHLLYLETKRFLKLDYLL